MTVLTQFNAAADAKLASDLLRAFLTRNLTGSIPMRRRSRCRSQIAAILPNLLYRHQTIQRARGDALGQENPTKHADCAQPFEMAPVGGPCASVILELIR